MEENAVETSDEKWVALSTSRRLVQLTFGGGAMKFGLRLSYRFLDYLDLLNLV